MLWVVKGYISHTKGFKVNWARVATSTTKEKAHRLVAKKMRAKS
jgi:hypothetical protein